MLKRKPITTTEAHRLNDRHLKRATDNPRRKLTPQSLAALSAAHEAAEWLIRLRLGR